MRSTMRRWMQAFGMVALVSLAVGCASTAQPTCHDDVLRCGRVRYGQSEQQVVATLGTPDRVTASRENFDWVHAPRFEPAPVPGTVEWAWRYPCGETLVVWFNGGTVQFADTILPANHIAMR